MAHQVGREAMLLHGLNRTALEEDFGNAEVHNKMRLIKIVVCVLLVIGCKPTSQQKYQNRPVVGAKINPSFLVNRIDINCYLLTLNGKYENGQTARMQNKISDADLEWLSESVRSDSAEILKAYKTGDVLWLYDNHGWNSFTGQSGLVLLRGDVVVWYQPGKHQ